MRMPRESGEIVGRVLVAEIVQQEERIELLGFAEAERALQLDAGAFDGGGGCDDVFHSAERHGTSNWGLQLLDSREGIFVATTIFSRSAGCSSFDSGTSD